MVPQMRTWGFDMFAMQGSGGWLEVRKERRKRCNNEEEEDNPRL